MRLLRIWWYFRRGWSTYISIPISIFNTLVILYYLLVNNIGFMKSLFPSFAIFVLVALAIMPVIIIVGWLDRKIGVLKTEMAVMSESNPYLLEILEKLDRVEKALNTRYLNSDKYVEKTENNNVLSGVLTTGPITVQPSFIPLTLVNSSIIPNGQTIQGQNNTFHINVTNTNNYAVAGKWVFMLNKTNGIQPSHVDVYVKPPAATDFVLLSSKIMQGGNLYIESLSYSFATGQHKWEFKLRFNQDGVYPILKIATVANASTPPFP